MLSDLPLSIIHIILALVPIRDAIRTSILSRQWRYTWTSLPHLVFEEHCPIRESKVKFEECMENFITHVLVLHKGPIHKLDLSVPFKRKCRNIGVWMRCPSMNDIRELIIDMDNSIGNNCTQELHSSIYSCKNLTKLELNYCALDPPPTTFKAFLFLKSLCLREVYMSTNEVESLVGNCPLLKDFTLFNSGNSELRISAPSLKVFHLLDDCIEVSMYAPLLVELSVELEDYGFRFNYRHDSSVCNYTNFMGGLTNLEKLSGYLYFTEHLSMGIESCHHTLVFHHLKDIELDEVDFEDIKVISVVVRLIVGAPNLQKLKLSKISCIDRFDRDDASEVPHVSFSDFICDPGFAFEKLKVVYMFGVNGLPLLTELIKFLLERSSVLEKMLVSHDSSLQTEEKQNLMAELLGCTRASANAKVSIY